MDLQDFLFKFYSNSSPHPPTQTLFVVCIKLKLIHMYRHGPFLISFHGVLSSYSGKLGAWVLCAYPCNLTCVLLLRACSIAPRQEQVSLLTLRAYSSKSRKSLYNKTGQLSALKQLNFLSSPVSFKYHNLFWKRYAHFEYQQ